MERIKIILQRSTMKQRLLAISALLTAMAVMIGFVTLNMRTVHVSDGAENRRILSMSTDAGAILRAAGLEVDEDDQVTAEWQFARGEVNVKRAFDVTVSVDGVTRVTSMVDGTVADALKKAGIKLGAEDQINVPVETELTKATALQVSRVTYKERREVTVIEYTTSEEETADLDSGERVVATVGENGERTKVYRDRLLNGKVVSTELVSDSVTKEPVNELILVGTYIEPEVLYNGGGGNGVPVNGPVSGGGSTGSFSYTRAISGSGTAYTNEGGVCGEYTASGMRAQRGVVAVDPNVIPYGTHLYIAVEGYEDYGYCVAGDTGGFVYNGTNTVADLFYDTMAECCSFGRRNITVYVLD
ncbi:MAG: G5 domain-containing protein [Clostridia bacterium]|nr:G5 domain-containing protein [Clostridia bacterium]